MNTKHAPLALLLCCFSLLLFSCQKEVSFETSNGSSNTGGNGGSGSGGSGSGGSSNATYYYKATIGGVNYYQDVTLTNDYIAGSGLGGTDDVDFTARITPMTPATNKTEFNVSKGILHNYLSATDTQFKAFFKTGSHPFTTGPESDPYQNGDGVYLYWVDKQGAIWSTIDGSGNQSGSNFKIISVEDAPNAGTYYIKVKMQFNCKLYKEGTGEMKELTNGEMVGLFGKI